MSQPQIIVAFSHVIGKLVTNSEPEAIGLPGVSDQINPNSGSSPPSVRIQEQELARKALRSSYHPLCRTARAGHRLFQSRVSPFQAEFKHLHGIAQRQAGVFGLTCMASRYRRFRDA
jgi:hypothetical protein